MDYSLRIISKATKKSRFLDYKKRRLLHIRYEALKFGKVHRSFIFDTLAAPEQFWNFS